jgi:hypothetical protein
VTVVTHTYRFSGAGEDFGPRLGRRLVILHTFENADPTKNKVVDALAGARWQDRDDTFGSYNRLIAVDGVVSCVPDGNASGGVNPASSFFEPRPWLYERLPVLVVNNPNAYALQLCAMGQRAYYDANGWPPQIIDGFARSILEEQAHGPQVISNHADFQPGNRSDAGIQAMALTLKRIAELTAQGSNVADITNYRLETIRIDAAAAIRSAPATGSTVLFMTGAESTAVSVGWKGDWIAYWVNDLARWGYTSISSNVLSREPYQNIVEVPTGITTADLDKARAEGVTAGKADMHAKAIVAAENNETAVRALK